MAIQEWNVNEPYIALKCKLGEGPYYCKERHELRFLDINSHKLFLVDLSKGPDSLRTIDTGMPVGVTADIEGVDPGQTILTGAKDGVTKFDLQTGKHEYVARYWEGADVQKKVTRMRSNDGAVDSSGRFWVEAFIDPEIEEPNKEGVLFRLDHNGKLDTMLENVTIPNGISWSPRNDIMYFTDSPEQKVFAFDYDSKSGSISGQRVFFQVEEEGSFPDGHAMDVEGNIWHACYGGSKVIRISPKGKLTGIVHLPTRNITCPTFVGTDLFITTAKEESPEEYPNSAKFAGSVFKIDVGIEGMPKHKAILQK